jgi:hyperosmotically inducible protein
VTLSGKVRSAAERTEAVRLARTTTGVKDVVSKLVVDPNYKGVTNKDDKAKAEAKEEAKEAKGTAGRAVDKTKETSKDAADKTKEVSKDAAQKTKDAAVKTKDVVADASVTSAVKTKLLADPKVGGLKIDVDTKDNVVTLTGVVNSVAEKNEALRLARTTTGVKSVVDKLTVK